MKINIRKLLTTLCLGALLLSSVACSAPSTTPEQTGGTEEITSPSGTGTATDAETDAETEDAFPEDYIVTEDGDTAHVFTPQGLKYTASGYQSLDKHTFSFDDTMNITFPEGAFSEIFNRFSFTYQASQPIKITVAYKMKTYDVTDYYFLEAGEGVFSGLPQSFMNEADCTAISAVTVESLTGQSVDFVLSDLSTEKIAVPGSSLYIENDRFKLGIDMSWGGTINYVEDKNCDIPKLNNLVNKHDTGRLIQQSFYGTAAIPGVYEPGISFDTQWPYNPVQGGDQYNNASLLIDLVVTENSVYIKSQPQDWSLDNQLTPSYMENTYILEDDHIRVNNRFVDFSGWTHPYSSQELPALYTVSYLDTFYWYDGEEPWTGDALSSRGDLNFWGDVQYSADCSFPLREGNSETWCAWINASDNYGLGIYVPNVDAFKAGRYEYNGTRSDKDDPTNYVAPLNIIKLVSYKPLEYSYILTAGSLEEIRATFTAHKDFSDNASLHQDYISSRIPAVGGDITQLSFDSQTSVNALTNPVSTTITFDEAEQAAKLTAGAAGDANVTINYGNYVKISADTHNILRIEYMIPTDNAKSYYECDIFLCAGQNKEPSGDARLRERLITDGEYHVLEIDLSGKSFWTGDIHAIRFDYFDFSEDGDVMYVKSITLE